MSSKQVFWVNCAIIFVGVFGGILVSNAFELNRWGSAIAVGIVVGVSTYFVPSPDNGQPK